MSLYHVQFDHESYYVEAPTFGGAVAAWRTHVAKLWGCTYEGTEEPESVALLHEDPVIRAAAPAPAAPAKAPAA